MPGTPCLLCGRPPTAHGLCHTHGERWRRWGKPPIAEWVAAFKEDRLSTCEVCGKRWNGYANRRTCSEACDKARRRRMSLARYHALPMGRKRELQLRAHAIGKTRRAATKRLIPCSICKEEFLGFPYRKFCSRECKRRDVAVRRDEIRLRQRLLGAISTGSSLRERMIRSDTNTGAQPDG